MPFDFAVVTLAPIDAETIHGVARHELVAHAMEQVPPALRSAVAEMEVSPGRAFVHMGMMFERVSWRAVWRNAGLPTTSGSFAVWNGRPV